MSVKPEIDIRFGEWLSKDELLRYMSFKSKTTVDNRMKNDKNFPKPSYAMGKANPRWKRTEIDEYMGKGISSEQ